MQGERETQEHCKAAADDYFAFERDRLRAENQALRSRVAELEAMKEKNDWAALAQLDGRAVRSAVYAQLVPIYGHDLDRMIRRVHRDAQYILTGELSL